MWGKNGFVRRPESWSVKAPTNSNAMRKKNIVFVSPSKIRITGGRGGGYCATINKNRLTSTTCGKELQKTFKDWQRLKGLYQKVPKKSISSDLRFWPLSTSKRPQNPNLTWPAQHNLGVPKIFNSIKFSVRALLRPEILVLSLFGGFFFETGWSHDGVI